MRTICFYRTSDDSKAGEMTMSVGGQITATGLAQSVLDVAKMRGDSPDQIFKRYSAWANQAVYSKEERPVSKSKKRPIRMVRGRRAYHTPGSISKAHFDPNEPRDEKGKWRHGGRDILSLLRESIQNAEKNKPTSKPITPRYGGTDRNNLGENPKNVKGAFQWHRKTGTVDWTKPGKPRAMSVELHGEGQAGTYRITGNRDTGFTIEANMQKSAMALLTAAQRASAKELVRDPDGSLVPYVELRDAQDAARELDGLVSRNG